MTIDRTPENAPKEDPPELGSSPTLKKTDPPDISLDSTKKQPNLLQLQYYLAVPSFIKSKKDSHKEKLTP